MTKCLVFLLEEPSAKDLIEGILPKIVPDSIVVRFLVFEGKQDLEKQMERKLRLWREPDSAFVVLRDQDAGDCRVVKKRLAKIVTKSGRAPVLIRIACRELESWILGDLKALAKAFNKQSLVSQANKAAYRTPDVLSSPVQVIRNFIPEYQKRDGARRVGSLLDPADNQSTSFLSFCSGIVKIIR